MSRARPTTHWRPVEGEGIASFPPFFGGPGRAQVIAALALHVHLTVPELLKVLGRKSPRTLYHLADDLKAGGLIESFHRRPSGRGRSVPRTQSWTLNRRHPWIWEIRRFARRLAKGMGIPGPSHLGLTKVRAYIGPAPSLRHAKKNSSLRRADRDDLFPIYGGHNASDLILLFLPHLGYYSEGVPVRKLARLLGLSRYGTSHALNALLEWGIIRQNWRGSERLVHLNPRYFCYESLKRMLLRIDQETGREFQYLASAYTRGIGARKIRAHRLKWWKSWRARWNVTGVRTMTRSQFLESVKFNRQ